jgi:hypothetical protein
VQTVRSEGGTLTGAGRPRPRAAPEQEVAPSNHRCSNPCNKCHWRGPTPASGAGVPQRENQRRPTPTDGPTRLCKQGVTGSIPVRSTSIPLPYIKRSFAVHPAVENRLVPAA